MFHLPGYLVQTSSHPKFVDHEMQHFGSSTMSIDDDHKNRKPLKAVDGGDTGVLGVYCLPT